MTPSAVSVAPAGTALASGAGARTWTGSQRFKTATKSSRANGLLR